MKLQNKHILLGITGGIAAYKSAALVRLLRKAGAEVRVIMTKSGKEFITPLTMETLSGYPVYDDMFARRLDPAVQHIELARWADLVLIAPATANVIAKLTHGIADDLLTTVCLATKATMVLAPAMNSYMWENSATQANIQALKLRKINLIDPTEGEQACGEFGAGRMAEPDEIMNQLYQLIHAGELAAKRVLITAGPTFEAIDPVRYIGNHSSGKMGFALAQAAAEAGAIVTLIAGPVRLATPADVKRVDITSAAEMYAAVMEHVADADIFISAAAVANYRVAEIKTAKIKSDAENLILELVKNPDIVSQVAALAKRPYVVGFAAETENLIAAAQDKLQKKQLDMIIANLVNQPEQGFGHDTNALTVLFAKQQLEFPLATKQQLARALIQLIAKEFRTKKS